MKRYKILAVALCFAGFAAWAAPKDQSVTGWTSDSKCGTKGASASHAACAKKCIDAGEKPVLVTDKDQKIVAIANPDAISADRGKHIEISGSMTNNGSQYVDKAQARP